MKVAIIKYNAGNIFSVHTALSRLGAEIIISDQPEELKSADRVIFPGVGEASTAMQYLRNRNLDVLIKDLKQPVLGICLGLQLMCRHSQEGETECLGIFPNLVKRFNHGLKVPQIGWNALKNFKGELFDDLPASAYCYFVHSYYAEINNNTILTADYGIEFSAGLQHNNFYALQFHPEKSADTGEKILRNFLEITSCK